jgi:disulfide bond formation protein DsbB
MSPDTINYLFALGILLSQVVILAILINVIFNRKSAAITFIGKHGILVAFVVSLASMVGSLFMSEVSDFQPCVLCWIQRIFHYSNVFILGLALFRKESYIIPYSLLLSYVGPATIKISASTINIIKKLYPRSFIIFS